MPVILITRPAEEAEALARALSERGFATFVEPLLHMEPTPENKPALEAALARKPQAIFATSRHGVKALADMLVNSSPIRGEVGRGAVMARPEQGSPHPNPPPMGEGINKILLFTVGTATAQYAQALGFTIAGHAETAQALCELAAQNCNPALPLLYVRGEHISTDIPAILAQKRFRVDSVILYSAIAAQEFSAELRSMMARGEITGAMFFSRRTASIYATLVQKHALRDIHRTMSAICMSEAVTEALSPLLWQSIRIAEKPDMEHMLEAAERIFE